MNISAPQYGNIRRPISKGLYVNAFLLLLTVVIAITPVLNRNLPKLIYIGIILLWYIEVFFSRRKPTYKAPNLAIPLFIWFCWELLLKVVGFSTAEIGNYFLVMCFFDLVYKSSYILQHYPARWRHLLLRIIQIIVLLNILDNIYLGHTIENIHYYIYDAPDDYINLNVAQTEFYNMLVYYIGICAYLLRTDHKFIHRAIDLIALSCSYYFMLSFEARTTSLTLSILLLLAMFIFSIKKRATRIVVLSFVAIVFIVIIGSEFDWLVAVLPERVSLRFTALSKESLGSSDYTSRTVLLWNNINTMFSSLSSFIFGVGNHLGSKYSSLIGQHSTITDYMAKYGCIGLAFIIFFFTRILKIFKAAVSNRNDSVLVYSFILIFITASILSNTFGAATAATGFVGLALLINSTNTTSNGCYK